MPINLPAVINPMTATHWGLCRPIIENGELKTLHAHEADRFPSPNLHTLCEWIKSNRRIRTPLIRRDFLKRGTESRQTRGLDDFVEVSWETALALAAREINRVYDQKGPSAVYGKSSGWKSCGLVHSSIHLVRRLLALRGGFVPVCGTYSTGAISTILPYVIGLSDPPAEPWKDILENATCVVFWGADPLVTNDVDWACPLHEGQAALSALRSLGTKSIFINPIRGETAKYLNSRWISVFPGSDCALMLALMHVLLTRDLVDLNLCHRLAYGVDTFIDYVLGHNDGQPKTPLWAEGITHIAAADIETLALELSREKTMLCFGWGPQRARFGEQFHFMAFALALFLGQIGLPGCGISTHHHYCDGGDLICAPTLPNPISSKVHSLYPLVGTNTNEMEAIPVSRLADMLAHPGKTIEYEGRQIRYPDIDLIVWAGGNPFSHQPDLNLLEKGWQKPSAVIVCDTHMTPTAQRADIVLPACSSFERNDITPLGTYANRGIAAMHQIMKPIGLSRSDYDIFCELASLLDLESAFSQNRSEADWIYHFYNLSSTNSNLQPPPFEEFWQKGLLLFDPLPQDPARCFWRRFRDDPKTFALPTPSGKIEIVSNRLRALHNEDAPEHPTYISNDLKDAQNHPFRLLSIKSRHRLHSQLDSISSLAKVNGVEICTINTHDASALGISQGDIIFLHNSRGKVKAIARVDDDVMQGCVAIAHGSWLNKSSLGVDLGCASNTLIPETPTSRLGCANIASGTGVSITVARIAQ